MPALLAVDDHLARCLVCRNLVAGGLQAGKLTLDDPDSHLSYEQLEAIAEGREAPDEHARDCPMCAEELKDLRALADKPRRSGVPWWLPAGAAVAAGIAVAVFAMNRPPAQIATSPSAVNSASLRDGSLTLALDQAGRITGAPFDAAGVNAALAAGEITGPAEWRKEREQLLGDSAATPASVIAPVAETVETTRPLFRWTPVKGASKYRVEVYDSQFNEVASSGPVSATEWQPERPLPRGKTYSWVVAAGSLRFPKPPAPEARFAVLADAAADEVQAARLSGSRLLLAVVAGRHGLWSEARAAVDEVAAQNPSNPAVQRLRESVQKKSSGTR